MDFDKFEDKLQLVRRSIKEALDGSPERLYDASLHLTSAGGKRIRPLLCLLSCEAVGGSIDDALKTAVAIELIHTFTLIHDDIMDKDELRRNVPSVHVVYGEPTAILAGDLLFSKAFEISRKETIKILAKAAAEICEGQEMDMSFEEAGDVTEKEYLEMIRKKTAVLLQAATESGAILGGGSDQSDHSSQVKKLSDYGLNIGMAFQIHDDVLDLLADEKKLGKPVGSDIVEGKRSLVVINALENLVGAEKEKVQRILCKEDNSPEEIALVVRLFEESGAITYCRDKAEHFINLAKSALDDLEESEAKNDLMDIAEYIIDRKE